MLDQKLSRLFTINTFHSAYDFRWDSNFSFVGEAHPFWEIVYVVSGAVEVTKDAQIFQLTEGDMVLHGCNVFHKIRSINNTSPRVFLMSFLKSEFNAKRNFAEMSYK